MAGERRLAEIRRRLAEIDIEIEQLRRRALSPAEGEESAPGGFVSGPRGFARFAGLLAGFVVLAVLADDAVAGHTKGILQLLFALAVILGLLAVTALLVRDFASGDEKKALERERAQLIAEKKAMEE